MKLTLGTVQFGLPYGKKSQDSLIAEKDVFDLLEMAQSLGITSFDCAQAYGSAEVRLGNARQQNILKSDTRIITKVLMPEKLQPELLEELAAHQVQNSCRHLQVDSLDTVLLHRYTDRWAHQEAYWQALLHLKNQGIIKKLGVSVYSLEQAEEAFRDDSVEMIQLPFNILDHRWRKSILNQSSEKLKQKEIHCRSIYLQGVLINDLKYWPFLEKNGFYKWQKVLDQLVERWGCESRAELCFRYVLSQTWIHHMVIGVDSKEQLMQNHFLFQKGPLSPQAVKDIDSLTSDVPDLFLNPGKWVEL